MAEWEKFQHLRLQIVEEVQYSDREKPIRETTDWQDVWKVIFQAVMNQHVPTCSFLPQTAQAAAWADHNQCSITIGLSMQHHHL